MTDQISRSTQRGASESRAKARKMPGRRPFWLPATSFYVLSLAASAGTFFLLWGILHDGREELPWVGAGLAASVVLGSAVFLREIVLRNARERYFLEQRKLDHSFRPAFASRTFSSDRSKITIEQNAEMLKVIDAKSEAARVLAKFGDAHREVFELCDDYLRMVEMEMTNVAPGSPRIIAFQRGKRKVAHLHHYHLMQMVETESRSLLSSSNRLKGVSERLRAAENAFENVETALRYYPEEQTLVESQTFLDRMITSLHISAGVEKAERAEERGEAVKALRLYRDALRKAENFRDPEFSGLNVAAEIRSNIVRLEDQTEDL